MRIAIDCQNIVPGYSGGTTAFARGLIRGLSRVDTKHELSLFIDEDNEQISEWLPRSTNIKVKILKRFPRSVSHFKSRASLLSFKLDSPLLNKLSSNVADAWVGRQHEIDSQSDFIYSPTVMLSYHSRKPTMMSLHDVQERHYPQFFSSEELAYRKVTYYLNAQNATYMQASSQFIKEDFCDYFKLESDRVIVIPEGVNIEEFRAPVDLDRVSQAYALPGKFLYYPGQLWLHKNHITVLKALKLLKQRGCLIPFIMTGSAYSAAGEIEKFISQHHMTDQVRILGAIPYSDVKVIYRLSHFAITAALYESSSLPVREAAATGVPIYASNIPPNCETSNVLRLNLFNVTDEVALADLILNTWNNEVLRKEQIDFNSQAIENYSWTAIAEKYLRVIEDRSR